MKRVFVNGYGSIGSRIAQFITDDSDIEITGVGKYSHDEKVADAISRGFKVYVPKDKTGEFQRLKISETIKNVVEECELVIDDAPGGVGYTKKKTLYRPKT